MDWTRHSLRKCEYSERLSAGMASNLVHQDRSLPWNLLPACLVRLQRSTDERSVEGPHAAKGVPRVEINPTTSRATSPDCRSEGAPAPDSFKSCPLSARRRFQLSGELTRRSGTLCSSYRPARRCLRLKTDKSGHRHEYPESQCQHVWIRLGRFWPVPRRPQSTAASTSSSDLTDLLDSRSSGVTQRTWASGRQSCTSRLGGLQRRPMRCPRPEKPFRGCPRSLTEARD